MRYDVPAAFLQCKLPVPLLWPSPC
jgi:hypothetical protein